MSRDVTLERADYRGGFTAKLATVNAGTMRLVLAYLLLGGLTLSPLLWTSVPSLGDYPNHLARMWVLAQPVAASSAPQNYVAHWQLLPTLAMDLVVPALAQLMSIEVAGRLFIASTMMLLVLGTVALHRVLWGRVGLWPLCSLLFLYNDAFYWGFLNYLFGLGLSLLAFSAWIATERWAAPLRLFAFSLAASLLFIMHLFAFGVYALLVVSYEVGNCRIERRSAREVVRSVSVGFAQLAAPALMWLATLSNGGPHFTTYGHLVDKVLALTAAMAYGEVGLVVIPVCFGLIYVGWRSGTLTLAPAMRWPVAVLVFVAALMPSWLYGSWGADMRLPIALSFIVVAGTRLRVPRRLGLGLGVIAVLFLVVRVYALTQSWREMDRDFGEFRTATMALPQGSRILVVESTIPDDQQAVTGVPEFLIDRQSRDFRHMAALTVIDRGAFIPFLFTGWTTVRPTQRNAGRYQSQGAPLRPDEVAQASFLDETTPNELGELPYWRDWPKKFEFVVWLDFGTGVTPLPEGLEPCVTGSFFRIYRIKPS